MKTQFIAILLVVLVLIAGCIQRPVGTSTLSPSATPSPTSTPAPSPEPTYTLTPTPSLALTPTPIAVSSSPLPVHGFAVGGKPFQFIGATAQNQWSKQTGTTLDYDPIRSARIDDLIKSARDSGITVLRPEPPHFESQLGVYQETELVKLDYLLDSAYRNGVYIIIPFIHAYGISLWPDEPYYHPGGIEGLVKDSKLKEAFKKRMAALITRVNTVNARQYSEDPTILSWSLLTELVSAPENYRGGPPKVTVDNLADWVEEMASYVKSLDANHLVTMNTHSGIAKVGDNWAKMLTIPALDFVEVEDAEARFLRLTQSPVDFYLKVFELKKPVIVMISFTGGALDQAKIGKDYVWQAEKLREIFKVYYEMGVAAGFAIYSWGSDLDVAYSPDKSYTYTASNKPIAQAFLDIASTLGPRNSTTTPLEFVRLRP